MSSASHPLAGALAQPLRVKYYVDGWNSWLFADAAVGVGRSLLEEALSAFPPHYAELFDFELTPERKALFVAGCLNQVQQLVVSRLEDTLRASGREVIDQHSALQRLGGWTRPALIDGQERKPFDPTGKTYFNVKLHGTVFFPELRTDDLKRQLNKLLRECQEELDDARSEYIIKTVNKKLQMLDKGKFLESQRYYQALGQHIGSVSWKGYYQATKDNLKIVGEKAVDMDMGRAMLKDVYNDNVDVLILITNDGDFYPAAEEAKAQGKAVICLRHFGPPAKALSRALGDENIIRFYDINKNSYDKYQFDFYYNHFLRSEDERSLAMIDDMRMQYASWEMTGDIKRPAFPPPSTGKAN
jgi:uncharacterized LabA/DUF88 family protein